MKKKNTTLADAPPGLGLKQTSSALCQRRDFHRDFRDFLGSVGSLDVASNHPEVVCDGLPIYVWHLKNGRQTLIIGSRLVRSTVRILVIHSNRSLTGFRYQFLNFKQSQILDNRHDELEENSIFIVMELLSIFYVCSPSKLSISFDNLVAL